MKEKFTGQLKKQKNSLMLIPVFGSVLFIVLYFVATLFYPGGSQVDSNSLGFSWADNYWCNLLNDYAINGQPNPSKPIAIAGMCVLCLSLSYFWLMFPNHVNIGKYTRLLIQISGVLSMAIAIFLFTSIEHDFITNLASIFGLIATTLTFIALFKTKWYGLFAFGLLNILLVGLNNYVYYNIGIIVYLPIIQKISFMMFLVWVCCIDIKIYLENCRNIKG